MSGRLYPTASGFVDLWHESAARIASKYSESRKMAEQEEWRGVRDPEAKAWRTMIECSGRVHYRMSAEILLKDQADYW